MKSVFKRNTFWETRAIPPFLTRSFHTSSFSCSEKVMTENCCHCVVKGGESTSTDRTEQHCAAGTRFPEQPGGKWEISAENNCWTSCWSCVSNLSELYQSVDATAYLLCLPTGRLQHVLMSFYGNSMCVSTAQKQSQLFNLSHKNSWPFFAYVRFDMNVIKWSCPQG